MAAPRVELPPNMPKWFEDYLAGREFQEKQELKDWLLSGYGLSALEAMVKALEQE